MYLKTLSHCVHYLLDDVIIMLDVDINSCE